MMTNLLPYPLYFKPVEQKPKKIVNITAEFQLRNYDLTKL